MAHSSMADSTVAIIWQAITWQREYLEGKALGCARDRGVQQPHLDSAADDCVAHACDEQQSVGVEDGVIPTRPGLLLLCCWAQQPLPVVLPSRGIQIDWLYHTHTQTLLIHVSS